MKVKYFTKYFCSFVIAMLLIILYTGVSYSQTTFSDEIVISEDVNGAGSVSSFDFDGDGDNDVLAASYYREDLVWFENNGTGVFGPPQFITDETDSVNFATGVDLDGDGDKDILSSFGSNTVAWFENLDGLGDFGPISMLSSSLSWPRGLKTADMDGDGDIDVLVHISYWIWPVEYHDILLFENTDGLGDFSNAQSVVFDADIRSYGVGDVDGDDDNDILKSVHDVWVDEGGDIIHYHALGWYANNGTGNFGACNYFDSSFIHYHTICADIDLDGDNDVISTAVEIDGWGNRLPRIVWFENIDGNGSFAEEQIIDEGVGGSNSFIHIDDLDLDNDIDVIISHQTSDMIAWYENTDGLGTFSERQVIDDAADGVKAVYSADIDGNGSIDVLSASFDNDKIAWYRNELDVPPLNLVAIPWEDPVIIQPGGGNFRWDVNVDNVSNEIVVFDAWTGLILPDGSPYEPLAIFNGLTLPPGIEIAASPNQVVPWFAPSGEYTYIARVGDSENGEIYAEDSFQFTKLPLQGAAVAQTNMTSNDGWILTDFLEMDETNVEETTSALPSDYIVENPFPNPFNPTTTINIGLPEPSFLRINVFNILGQQVDVLANNQVTAGYHSFLLDGSNLTSGVYFIHTNAHDKLDEIGKVVLMK